MRRDARGRLRALAGWAAHLPSAVMRIYHGGPGAKALRRRHPAAPGRAGTPDADPTVAAAIGLDRLQYGGAPAVLTLAHPMMRYSCQDNRSGTHQNPTR